MSLNLRSPVVVTEVTQSISNLPAEQFSIVAVGANGTAGEAMGVMGLTYTQQELAYGILEYQTKDTSTRLKVRLDK